VSSLTLEHSTPTHPVALCFTREVLPPKSINVVVRDEGRAVGQVFERETLM
jgi:hypothetical protein